MEVKSHQTKGVKDKNYTFFIYTFNTVMKKQQPIKKTKVFLMDSFPSDEHSNQNFFLSKMSDSVILAASITIWDSISQSQLTSFVLRLTTVSLFLIFDYFERNFRLNVFYVDFKGSVIE